MKTKITRLIVLLSVFLSEGGNLAIAQSSTGRFFAPGSRKTSLAVNDEIFIYNTCMNGTEDRTGFIGDGGSNWVLLKKKPFAGSTNNRFYIKADNTEPYVWVVASIEEADGAGYQKVSFRNKVTEEYIAFNGATTATGAQYVYIKNYTSCTATTERSGVSSEDAEGNSIADANLPTDNSLWAIRTASGSGNFWNGNPNGCATWGTGHPYAFYTVVDVTAEYDALAADAKTSLATAVTNAQTKFTDAGFTGVTNATLTVAQLSSNAEENSGGGFTDGGGLAALIDETTTGEPNLTTYYHSRWSGTAVNEYHYIQVDLGESEPTSAFTFTYSTRPNGEQNPTAITVSGSNDGTNFVPIKNLTAAADGLPGTKVTAAALTYTSPLLLCPGGTAYRYLRFTVTANRSGGTYAGYPFFAMSNLGVTRYNGTPTNTAYSRRCVTLQKLYYCMTTAEAKGDAMFVSEINALSAEITSLTTAAGNIPTYPFTLTTDFANPTYYAIQSGRGNNHTFTLKPGDGGKVKLEQQATPANNAFMYWFFVEDPNTGALLIYPFIDPTNPLGYTTVGDGPEKLTNVPTTTNYVGHLYTLVESGNATYPYALKPYGYNTYVSNWGGAANFMGFYSGMDGGTQIKFVQLMKNETESATPVVSLRELNAPYGPCKSLATSLTSDNRIGNGLNQYSTTSAANLLTPVQNAESLLTTQALTATSDDITAAIAALPSTPYSVLEINQPTANKFYRLRCADTHMKFLQSDKNMTAGERGATSIFYLTDDQKLVAYKTGLYLIDKDFAAADGTGATITFQKAANGTLGKYNIKAGNRYQYGANNTIDSGGSTNATEGYNWWLEEVTELPVSIGSTGYATLYTPVALTIPDGMTVYKATYNDLNTLRMTPIEGTIPDSTGIMLKGTPSTDYTFAISSETPAPVLSALIGNIATKTRTSLETGTNLVLTLQSHNSSVAFKHYTGTNVSGFKAHLPFDSAWLPSSEGEAKALTLIFEDGVDAIDQVPTELTNGEQRIYSLTGVRRSRPMKGLNIINGKKVLVTD